MTDLKKLVAGTAAAAVCVLPMAPAQASSHREAPFITELPKVDNTDFYMFRSYEPGRENYVTIVANFQPLQVPFGGPQYFTMDPDALYEIHIDNNGDAIEDITWSFQFNNELRTENGIALDIGGQSIPIPLRYIGPVTDANDGDLNELEFYTVTQVAGDRRSGTRTLVSNPAGGTVFQKPLDYVGEKTVPNYEEYARQFMYNVSLPGCSQSARVFVGQRGEAFAVNLGETFDLVNYVPIEGDTEAFAGDGGGFPGGITQSREHGDLIGQYNVTSIAMEVPIECLTMSGNPVIGGWSSASLPQARVISPTPTYEVPTVDGGPYVQVSRLGNPLVNEIVIGLPQKNLFNAAEPTQDSLLAEYVTHPTFPAILDKLFREPVNATLGTSIDNLAPAFFPRVDLVATFLTGIETLNQPARVVASEMLRLNTSIAPTPRGEQRNLGALDDDLSGFPNGRRPGDDVVDIVLRVAMGRLCYPIPINGNPVDLGLCEPSQAPVGNVPFTDGAPVTARDFPDAFPYLPTPIPGSPEEAREARSQEPARP